jgi:hypothetical protein
MIPRTKFQLSTLQVEEFLPEFTSEDAIAIRHNRLREAMEFDKIIYEGSCHRCRRIGVPKSHEMGCFGESINDHHDHSIATGVRECINKIHGQLRPDAIGHKQRLQQPCRGHGLIFIALTYLVFHNVGADIRSHMWPIEELIDVLHHFQVTGVARGKASMKFIENNGPPRGRLG